MYKRYLGCLLILIPTLTACDRARNYPDAYIISNNKHFIKLRGKRNLMVHDPISLFKGGTYEDSVLIPMPGIKNGKVSGREIVFDNGSYKDTYDGYILISGNKLKINLYNIDTADKGRKIYYCVWNGEYLLHGSNMPK